MPTATLPPPARLKLDLLFEGLRYTPSLGEAAAAAYPNFYPYRFEPGEDDPTGTGKAEIPYLLSTADGTTLRIKGSGASGWHVAGSEMNGYTLHRDGHGDAQPVSFEPRPEWMSRVSEGRPLAQSGVSLHCDMAVVNVAPGCEYFLHKQNGKNLRCSFCAYGAPDERTRHLGQVAGQVEIPGDTLALMKEALRLAMAETTVRHVYLVGGSLPDWKDEAARFLQLARAVQEVVQHRVPVTLGSGALPGEQLERFAAEKLVDAVCFNLEVWSEPLFRQVCPGKHAFVGYQRWLQSLEDAVAIFGRERVYSAMVAGIELEPEFGMDWESASALVVEGAEALCARGILPIYSLYWPVGGRGHPEYLPRLRAFFESLNLAYGEIRRRYELSIWEGFMCHRCAYMQLECDLDRAPAAEQS